MMPFLQTYIDNLISDWQLNKAALRSRYPQDVLSLQANAKQEQIINDLKSLYDASFQQIVTEGNDHCKWLCGYIHEKMQQHYPFAANNMFNLHLTKAVHLQTNFHGCIAD
jgi:hypothetical protein